MTIEQSITKNQVDSDTATVNRVIAEVAKLAGRKGVHRNPIVLVAPVGNRVEYLQIVREVARKCELDHGIRSFVTPGELVAKVFEDSQPDSCVFAHGERLSPSLQAKLMEHFGDDVKRYRMPEVFIILTSVQPQLLLSQKVWCGDFGEFIGGRIVCVPTAGEREVSDLINLYRSAVQRAATRKRMRFEIKNGAIDLLTTKWKQERPASLDLIVQGAEKCVEDAHNMVIEIASRVLMQQKLVITGRQVTDAFLPDSPLASTRPSARPSRPVVVSMRPDEDAN